MKQKIMIPFSVAVSYMNGRADGAVRISSNPNIIIYQIPRESVNDLADVKELKRPGIYFLVNEEARTIYVGQGQQRADGEGVLRRMLEPHSSVGIDNWSVGFVLLGCSRNFLGVLELNYLERFFYDRAKNVKRYAVLNKNRPTYTHVEPSSKMVLDNYTDLALFLLWNQLRFRGFSYRAVGTTERPSDQLLYLVNEEKGVNATGTMLTDKEILVKKGSKISQKDTLSEQGLEGYAALRQRLIDEGIIKDCVFLEDHEFSSTSAAASVILGQAASGTIEWRTTTGGGSNGGSNGGSSGKSGGNSRGIRDLTSLIGKTLYLANQKKGANAVAVVINSKSILVKAGSMISTTNNLPNQKGAEGYGALRQELINNGIIVNLTFTRDYEFSATSPAASVILGRSASGMVTWEDENGDDLMTLLSASGQSASGQSAS